MVVQCTWKAGDGRDITDAVNWSSIEEKQNDVEDEVQAENCLLLQAPSAGTSEYLTVPACQLLLSCQPPNQIQYFSVLSEAKVLEVYGHHGEYMKTVRNELLEEVDDMAVYRGDVTLDRPLQLCSIKFACLRSKSEMWLYGVKVITSKATESPDNMMKIQFTEVEHRLEQMGLELSDKAGAFKELFQLHQNNPTNIGAAELSNFIGVLKMMNLTRNRIQDIMPENSDFENKMVNDVFNRNLSPTLNHTLESPFRKFAENVSPSTSLQSNCTQTDDPLPKDTMDNLKGHIENKFAEHEDQLRSKIEKRFEEMEAKIFCKLEEILSFVKPQGIDPKP